MDHSIQGHVVTRDPGLDDSPSWRICLVTKLYMLQMYAKQMQKKKHITLSINPLRDDLKAEHKL